MLDACYTKRQFEHRLQKHVPASLAEGALNEIATQIRRSGARVSDLTEYLEDFVLTVIVENQYWPAETDIEAELHEFFRAIRSGDVELKAVNVNAYAEAHRTWKRSRNRNTSAPVEIQAAAGIAKNDSTDFNNPNAWCLTEAERWNAERTNEIRRNLVDWIEGFENIYCATDERRAACLRYLEARAMGRTTSGNEMDLHLFGDYKQALDIYKLKTGQPWKRFSQQVTYFINQPRRKSA